jgi:hypothetical protein
MISVMEFGIRRVPPCSDCWENGQCSMNCGPRVETTDEPNLHAPDRRYAADCRRQSMIEDVARALCDACYGDGAWERISRRPEGQGQVQGWMAQARAAVAVVERWTQ